MDLVVEAFRLEFGHVHKIEFGFNEEFGFHIVSVRINFNLHLEITNIVNLNLFVTVPNHKRPRVETAIALLHIPRIGVHAVRPLPILDIDSPLLLAQHAFLNF